MTKRFVIPGAAQRRPGIHSLAAAPEQASNVLRAEWIPACAGMTKRFVIPGGTQPLSSSSRAKTRDPPAGGSARASLTVIRDEWIPAYAGMTNGRVATACPLPWFAVPLSGHPGRRPGIHGLAETSDVRWDLQRDPGRVDSRLRGNDKNAGGSRLSPAVVRGALVWSSRA